MRWSKPCCGGIGDSSSCLCFANLTWEPKPVVEPHILTVALLMRSKASRQASAGGHLSMRSPSTEVAARTVKSTSSRVYELSAKMLELYDATYQTAADRGRMPDRVEKSNASHEEMYCCEVGVIHQMHSM